MYRQWGRTAVLTLLVLLISYGPLHAQTEALWLAPVDGDWSDASNWSTDPSVPNGVGFDALLDVVGSPYVATVDQNITVQHMTIDSPDATVLLDGGNLTAPGGITINDGELRLRNGTVYNTRIDGPGFVTTQRDLVNGSDVLTLENVTLATTLKGHLNGYSHRIRLPTDLELDNGVVELGAGADLRLIGDVGITGTGEVTISPDGNVYNPDAGIYLDGSSPDQFIGPGVSVRALDGWLEIDKWYESSRFINFTNYGLIEAKGPQGAIDIKYPVRFYNEGTLRVADGALLNIDYLAPGAKIGSLEIGPGSSIYLDGIQADPVTNVVYEFDQPVTIPEGAELRVDGGWENNTTLTFDGGTFRVGSNGNSPGNLVFQNGATISIDGLLHISRLAELGSTPTTRIKFQSQTVVARSLDLEHGSWDLNSIPGQWDFTIAPFLDGTLTGLPNGNNIAQETDSVQFKNVNLDLPLVLSAGRARLRGSSSILQPATVAGGTLTLYDDWTNSGGITMTSGVIDMHSQPETLGAINVQGGEINLRAFPQDPSAIQLTGGKLSAGFDMTLSTLRNSPWTPDEVGIGVGVGAILDLEGATLELGTDVWQWSVNDSGEIRNGTISDPFDAGPLVMHGGKLRDLTLYADLLTDETVSLYGQLQIDGSQLSGSFTTRNAQIQIDGSHLAGDFAVGSNTELTLNDTSIDGLITFRGTGDSGPPVTIHGLTGNGEIQLGTRLVTLNGTQTIDGMIEFNTEGYRSNTGGGIQAVNGDLTLGPDVTFHSRRNGSLLLAEHQSLINDGTIIADLDEYADRFGGVLDPSITIRAGSVIQRGTVQVTDEQEIHIDTTFLFNEGLIEIQRLGLLSVTGKYIQTPTGILDIEVDQESSGDLYDPLFVDGRAYLDGALNIRIADGYFPESGDLFTIIDTTSGISGDFSAVLLPELGGGLSWLLVAEPGTITLEVVAPIIPGDANGDGVVDGIDYLVWATNYGDDPANDPPGSPENGDFNVDGVVDGVDYIIWATNYSGGPSTTVPEPAAGLLLATSLAIVFIGQRR